MVIKYLLAACILFSAGILLIAADLTLYGNIASGSVCLNPGNFAQILAAERIQADAALFIGCDGTAAFIERTAFEAISLCYDDSLWISQSSVLPPVCNIKNLAAIALWSSPWHVTLDIVSASRIVDSYSPFTFIMAQAVHLASSSRNGYAAEKYLYSDQAFAPDISGKIILHYAAGDKIETVFQPALFEFDGYNFYYEKKPVKKIEEQDK
jgi:hypothetical protein